MVRNYVRKTAKINTDVMLKAIKTVKLENKSIRSVAASCGIPYRRLSRYCAKFSAEQLLDDKINKKEIIKLGWTHPSLVFTEEQERNFAEYIVKCSDRGISSTDIRRLAYEYGKLLKLNLRDNWIENQSAGADWYEKFVQRHSEVFSNCKLDKTSDAATQYIKLHIENLKTLISTKDLDLDTSDKGLVLKVPKTENPSETLDFDTKDPKLLVLENLKTLLKRHKFNTSEIWCIAETSISNVSNCETLTDNDNCRKTRRNKSLKRDGNVVTVIIAVSSSENITSPFFIFPTEKFEWNYLKDGPLGSSGCAHPSGLMTNKNFYNFLQHFAAMTKCTKDNPVLLLLDNQESFLSLPAIEFSKNNGICMSLFPQYDANILQPLGSNVYGPFKHYIKHFCDDWTTNNPDKSMTIDDVSLIVKRALELTVIPLNNEPCFESTEIPAHNNCVFLKTDFLFEKSTDMIAALTSAMDVDESVEMDPLADPNE